MDYDAGMQSESFNKRSEAGFGRLSHPLRLSRRSLFSGFCLALAAMLLIFPGVASGQNTPQRRKDLQTFEEQYRKQREEFQKKIQGLIQERRAAGDETAVQELLKIGEPIDRERLRGRKLPEGGWDLRPHAARFV